MALKGEQAALFVAMKPQVGTWTQAVYKGNLAGFVLLAWFRESAKSSTAKEGGLTASSS